MVDTPVPPLRVIAPVAVLVVVIVPLASMLPFSTSKSPLSTCKPFVFILTLSVPAILNSTSFEVLLLNSVSVSFPNLKVSGINNISL